MGIQNKNYIQVVILLIFSVLFFEYWQGSYILIPTNTNWLLSGDLSHYYASSSLYRYSDYIFPLGDLGNADYPVGSNIIFSDGNLFLSLILKFLDPFIPAQIQLYGLWLLFCTTAQFLSTWWVLKQLRVNGITLILGAILIGLYPAFYFRASHLNLMAHFIIILSIGIYFSKYSGNRKIILLNLLLVFATMVHAYFVPIVLGCVFLVIIENLQQQRNKLIWLISSGMGTLLLLFLVMYAFGYFSSFEGKAHGFGFYSMNINSPFNSLGLSSVFSQLPIGTKGQYEGFQYLGLGVLFFSFIFFITNNTFKYFKSFFSIYLILFVMIVTLISLSNKWYFGNFLLFEQKLDEPLINLFSTFRASGRFFWIVGYLMILTVIAAMYQKFNKCNSIILPSLLLLSISMQLYDLEPLLKRTSYDKKEITTKNVPEQEHIELSNALEDNRLYTKPIFIDNAWGERVILTRDIVHLAGSKIFSIGPWITVRNSLRFKKIDPKLNYLDYVSKNKGVYISKNTWPPSGFNKIIFQGSTLTAFQYDTDNTIGVYTQKFWMDKKIVIVVRDEGSQNLEKASALVSYLSSINSNITKLKYRDSYIVAVVNNKIIYEIMSQNEEYYKAQIEGHNVELLSAGKNSSDKASVTIDGKVILQKGARGLNIVDIDTLRIYQVDTH